VQTTRLTGGYDWKDGPAQEGIKKYKFYSDYKGNRFIMLYKEYREVF
jgi:hypothetical protein